MANGKGTLDNYATATIFDGHSPKKIQSFFEITLVYSKSSLIFDLSNGGATGKGRENQMAKASNTIEFKVSEAFEVGAILVDVWGFEQTNIGFYAILKRSGAFVTIVKLKQQSTPVSSMVTSEMPMLEIDESEKQMRKKIKMGGGEERGFSLRDYTGGGWVKLWTGRPVTATHYA